MKVAYFHQHFSTPQGAAGTRSYEVARRLVARGHQVTMVCGSYSAGKTGLTSPFKQGMRKGMVDGIEVIEFALPYSNRQGFLTRTWMFMRFATRSLFYALSAKYDLVFATSTPLTAGIPGIAAKVLRRKPFVFEVRDLWPELPRAMGVIKNRFVLWMMSILEWSSYHAADLCISLAPGISDGIAARGIARERIELIPNGCDVAVFGARETTGWRPTEIHADDLLVVFAGAHGEANGLDAVLDAAAVLQRRARKDIKLLLIGEGKQKDRLRRRAHDEGLRNVVFHDSVDKVKLTGLFSAADVGMQILANVPAFYYGTSPNKFFDYLAAGLPVLNNYPGWVADLITEYNAGIAVPPEDPEAFADALEAFGADPYRRREMGRCARRLAEQNFNRDLQAERFVNALERVAYGEAAV